MTFFSTFFFFLISGVFQWGCTEVVGILRYLRVCGCCTGGERDGKTKQEWGGFLTKRTTTRTYILLVIKLYLLSLDI
jgi:hypothetical protein